MARPAYLAGLKRYFLRPQRPGGGTGWDFDSGVGVGLAVGCGFKCGDTVQRVASEAEGWGGGRPTSVSLCARLRQTRACFADARCDPSGRLFVQLDADLLIISQS